jgi:hypothetical protein
VSPVRYELGVYIPEDGILHSHRRENLKAYSRCLWGGYYHRLLVFLRSVLRLLITAYSVPSSPILVTLMMEATHSYETSVLARTIWRHIP